MLRFVVRMERATESDGPPLMIMSSVVGALVQVFGFRGNTLLCFWNGVLDGFTELSSSEWREGAAALLANRSPEPG